MENGRSYGRTIGLLFLAASTWTAALCGLSFDLEPTSEDLLTRQTARAAVGWWGISMALLIAGSKSTRLAWTIACLSYVVHVCTAFHEVHQWKHAEAWNHVDNVTGFGPGIFVSYLFTAIWVFDVCWWWAAPRSYETRSRRLHRATHGFFIFVVFNGTVVYESGLVRWGSVLMFGLLVLWAWIHHRHQTCGNAGRKGRPDSEPKSGS